MSFAAAVQWWEDWQLRLLVLASLFFQYFLFAAAVVRKLRVPHWFRALIWLAYQAGDVVAIYALATLFNSHKEEALARNPAATAHLDTLWAPVLLLHLGGQDGITAYSIEDNDNWRRYLLLAGCQITVAIYVFRKSWWSGDQLLLRAAILLFVPGILKCLEKPWALKNATVTSIMNSSDPRLERTLDEDDDGGVQKHIYSQEDYVQAAADTFADFEPKADLELFDDEEVADQPYHLLVDLGHPYSIRLRNLQLVAPRAARADVHGLVRSSLSRAFDRVYTKHKASFGGLLRAAVVLLTFVDIGLFQRSRHRRGVYDRADVVVTYVLLCCTAALEFVSACLVLGSGLPKPDDQLAQYNLVGYLARGEKHPWLSAVARLLGARLQLDRLWCTAPPVPSLGITRLVYDHVAAGWKDYIWESLYEHDVVATGGWKRKPTPTDDGVRAYRQFNDSRGQRTLEREGCSGRSAVEESLRMPFDESVLLWHLATELCYFDHVDTGHDATRHSRMVSNYMAYLLVVEPEMLIAGARSRLFRATYHKLRKMLKPPPEEEEVVELEATEKKAPPPRAKNEMVRKVIQQVKSSIGLGSEDLVHKAWAVANELMEFAEEKRQEFIKDESARKEKMETLKVAMDSAKNKAVEHMECKEICNCKMKEKMETAKENAEEFINVEKKKKQNEDEERLTQLLEKAKNKAEELIKNDEKTAADVAKEEEKKKQMVKDFSNSAQAVIKEIDDQLKEEVKKQQQLTDLVERSLITNEKELLMIRSREHADDKMWAVIQGVWVEMLCFSAGRCRGYLHAKSLGNGGEYLSYVWLLLYYMGMETMPERMQRLELPTVGDTGDLVKTPTDEEMDDDDEPAQGTTAAPRRRRAIHAAPSATPQPQAGAGAASVAQTAPQQQRLVATPLPAISATAVVPVGDDIV
ncbi:uncharacterized protein LOC8062642 [Sorghum bicolor]|uniref:DUF4220 domain-containing protein n=1 Tax=Sorghum bicolor TaxID=4558 RepID=C5Y4W5_SORBI|nr:uncharacterized protein LOC8062642 [Sorghum bicolor]EES09980.1 hypothetical protein SORBI_3005G161000 [Sorghum bicolor]|eukprot:XP_002450992.1 uncharacterized protein LOC8062642 [Sorghum bicolor]